MKAALRSVVAKKAAFILLFLIVLSIFCLVLRLKNLGRLSLWMDEGFYYLAADKILEHGYPLYPSGHILFKGILYAYVLSLVGLVFGVSEFSLRAFSVLVSVATISVFYVFAKKFAGRIVALFAAVLMVFSAWESEYARTVIYFVPLQLVCVAGLYFFYKGFFEDEKKYRIWTFVVFFFAPHIHQLAMGLWFCFPALFLVRGAKRFFKKDVLISLGLISLSYILLQIHEVFFWKVGYVYEKEASSLKEGLTYFFKSFSLTYFKEVLRSFPQMGLLLFFGIFVFLGEYAARKSKSQEEVSFLNGWYYLNLCLIFPLLFLGFFRTHIQPRYLFQLRPLIILLFLMAVWRIARIVSPLLLSPFQATKKEEAGSRLLAAGLFVLGVFLFTDQAGWRMTQRIIQRDYKDKIEADVITRSGRLEHEDHRGAGEYVSRYRKPDDLVIAIHVVFQYIYAGRVDYWLWTGGPGTWDAWEKAPDGWKDVYVGARWINTLETLKAVIDGNSQRRVWLITSPSIFDRAHIHQDVADFILGNSDKLVFRGRDGMSEVYLWHDEEKTLFGPNHTLEGEWIPASFGKIIYDENASKGSALYLGPDEHKAAETSFLLPKSFSPGYYKLCLRWKSGQSSGQGKGLGLVILAPKKRVALFSRFLKSEGLTKESGYQEGEHSFYVPEQSPLLLKFFYAGGGEVWLDYLDIVPGKEN